MYDQVDIARMARARADIAALQDVANRNGYALEFIPTRRVRGWPVTSAKPFALYSYCDGEAGGQHLASFATFADLERNFRARAAL